MRHMQIINGLLRIKCKVYLNANTNYQQQINNRLFRITTDYYGLLLKN